MAQKAADQITLVDLTDGVSVVMSSEAYAFPGTTTSAIAGSTTTKIQALVGDAYVAASINLAEVVKPAGVTVTSDNHATSPTLTISVTTAVTDGGVVQIPVVVQGLTITKDFTYSIAFKGTTGGKGDKGDKGDTGPTGAPAVLVGLKNEAHMIPCAADGKVLAATSISVDFYGFTGATRAPVTASVGTLPSGMTAGTNTAGTTGADGVLTLSVAANATLGGGDSGLVQITLTCAGVSRVNNFSWAKAKVGATGGKGDTGAPAISLEVSSSQGLIFKNTQVDTVLTSKVFRGGVEVTGSGLTALGVIKWYKDGTYLSGKDGVTLSVTAGQVTDKATYEARLDG